MIDKIKNFLNSDMKGSQAVESVILAPLMFVTFMILLYFFFMSLTYISFNNLANSMAQDLNMRQTGYEKAIANNPYISDVWTYREPESKSETPTGRYLYSSDVVVEPETQALRSGVYYTLDKHKGQIIIPFSEVKKINVTASQSIETSKGRKLAGTLIKVEISYSSSIFGNGNGFGKIDMKAIGYNIIT